MNKKQELIKYIKEQLPEINETEKFDCPFCKKNISENYVLRISLEDILGVWEKLHPEQPMSEAKEELWGIYCEWVLGKDLNNQSEEFYNWLYDLLIKTV